MKPLTRERSAASRVPAIPAAAAIMLGLASSVSPAAAQDDKYATAEELGLMKGFPPPADKQVTKANAIQNAPYNRWAYQHMRMIYPSAPVRCPDTAIAIERVIDSDFE